MICIAGRRLGCLGDPAWGVLTGTNLQGRCRSSSAKIWRRWRELHSRWSALRADALLSWLHRLGIIDRHEPFKAGAVLHQQKSGGGGENCTPDGLHCGQTPWLSWLHRLGIIDRHEPFKAGAVLHQQKSGGGGENCTPDGLHFWQTPCCLGYAAFHIESCAPGLVDPKHMCPVSPGKLAVFFLLDLL